MTNFSSNAEAMKKVEEIANTKNVHFTNEGLEILYTSDFTSHQEVVEKLKTVFSDVKIKGRKVKSILVNRLNQSQNGIRISQVTY